jgi:uncharacterized protein
MSVAFTPPLPLAGMGRGWGCRLVLSGLGANHGSSSKHHHPLPHSRKREGVATRLAAALVILVTALSFLAPAAHAAPTFPALTGRVVDDAHVLSAQTVSDLTGKLADLETRTGRQVVVVTLASLQGDDIEDYGYQLGRAWGIGQKGQNNGVLFIVVPSEHKVRIEVGYGLEPVLTDAMSTLILQEQVLPKFRSGDVEGGVVAGTNAIIQQLSLDPATATANVQRATQATRPHGIPFGAVFALIVLFLVFSSLFRRHWGGGGMGWWLPMMIMSSGSRGGGWGGGWSGGGGGFGGGGFSGGGGSFGGGGASGSW